MLEAQIEKNKICKAFFYLPAFGINALPFFLYGKDFAK
jgi:hypothetical protein